MRKKSDDFMFWGRRKKVSNNNPQVASGSCFIYTNLMGTDQCKCSLKTDVVNR